MSVDIFHKKFVKMTGNVQGLATFKYRKSLYEREAEGQSLIH